MCERRDPKLFVRLTDYYLLWAVVLWIGYR